MKINNNFNVLPFYDSLQKLNSNKWYSFGQHYPLICPNNEILPFQFIVYNEITLYNIEAVNVETGKVTDLGVKPGITAGTQGDLTYYVVKSPGTSISEMPEGLHYLRMNTSEGYIYSEEFVFCDNYSNYIKLEYWNEDTLRFSSGEINFDDDFRFILYIPSTIGKPEYEFEEELTKRLGYKFIESQTSNKIYKFNFLAPEYICDAIRLVRMCDYIKLTTKYDTYNALTLSYNPKWQENGDLAAVDVEFETDCIIQKLESFNRRIKESFYNALLADIEEPMLFSTDVVAQYYTEYTSVNYINGKLIRQLESASKDEIRNNLGSIVLPIDNQSDTSQEAKKVFLQDILGLVDTVSKLFRGHYDEAGNLLWIEALSNVGVNGGVTMFIDNGSLSLPTVAEGLPFDQKTIWYNPTTKRIEVLTSTDSGGSEGGVSNFWDLNNIPSWITANKPVYTYSEINEAPSSLKSPYALTFGSKTYDGSAAKTILASDLGALTAHQAIYTLTFQTGAFSAGSFTANSETKTINIPTTTSHISEGTNLYFTNARAVNALTSTLAKYVTLAGSETITGSKNFTGGLKVNGSPIVYDADNKYWKLEGDLLVTGGVAMYSSDTEFTPSTIMDAIVVDNVTIVKQDGKLVAVGGGVADSVAWGNVLGKPSWITDTTPYVNISGTKVSLGGSITQAALRTALGLGSNAYSSTAYLPLTGGTITASGVPLMINRTGYTVSAIHFQANSVNVGRIGVGEDNNPKFMKAADGTWHNIWHSGNHGSGSSLDADLLDGMHANKSNTPFGTIPCVKTDGVMEVGHYMDFHYDNTTNSDYSTRIQVTGNYSNTVSLPSNTGTLALTSSNVASATKLQTARTIWGQSFDGTGNINGNLLATIASDDQLRIKVANNLCAGSILVGSTGNFGLYDEINGAWLIYTDGTSVFSSLKNMIQRANLTMQNAKYLQWYQSDNATPMTIMYVNSSNSLVLGKGVAQVGGWTYIDGKVINFRYGTTPTTGMMLNSNGGLTIGPSDLASSSYKLYVDGATRITGNIIFGGEIYKPIPSGGTYKPFRIIQTADYALIQVSSHDGTSANGVLQLAGGLNGSLSQFKVLAGTSYISGKLGLGVSAPTEKLHVAGNILATGGVTMYSMRSLKNVVDERGLSLEELSVIKPTRYTWRDGRDNKLHIGGIADDVMKVLPEVVYKTEGGVLTMDYGNAAFAIAASLINPIVEHERNIKFLQLRARELEEEIKRIKSA